MMPPVSMTLARVRMPEKGVFVVRIPASLVDKIHSRAEVMVTLDYGLDVGIVDEKWVYNPAVDGPRTPGFQLVRVREPGDDSRLRENENLADKMCQTFVRLAAPKVPGLRVPYARLSFGRDRLFLRFMADQMQPNISAASADLHRAFGVQVSAWQMGPRDEAGVVGCLGVCGRVACCASWQKRFPTGLTADLARSQGLIVNPSLINGSCGRFKCCLAFEHGHGCSCKSHPTTPRKEKK